MARIRTIKPEFWTDGAIIRLPYETRLFFIGLWNFACDRGHVEDDPFGLKLKILPADPVDGDELVQRLVDAGRVERISAGGKGFLFIPSFTDHQRLDTRWKSRCVACTHLDSIEPAETHASSDETQTAGTETSSRRGGEGKGKEGRGGEVASDNPRPRSCSKHSHWDHEERCRACARDREAHEAEKRSVAEDARRRARRQPHACPHGFPPHEACEKCGDQWPGR